MRITQVLRLTAVVIALGAAGGLGLLATQAWADKPPAKETKSDKLEGTWQVTAFIKDGVEGPKEDADATKLVLSGESFTHIHAHVDHEEKETGKFKADATQKPPTLDIAVTEGNKAGEGLIGIYKLDGDTLTICFAHKGSPRPTKFESTAGSGLHLITLKRVKE